MNTTKQIYTKDKKVKITFRCDEGLGDWIGIQSALVKLTPSAFVRQMMYQQMYAEKTIGAGLKQAMARKAISSETAVSNADH